MTKNIILNIDDFGKSDVNNTLNSIRLTKSVSIMTEESGFEEAVVLARKLNLDVGLHLDVSHEREIENQITKCINAGLSLSHIDSHKHKVYEIPSLYYKTIELSHKFGIPFITLNGDSLDESLISKEMLKHNTPYFKNLFNLKDFVIDDYCYPPHYLTYYSNLDQYTKIYESYDAVRNGFKKRLDEIQDSKVTVIAMHPSTDKINSPAEYYDFLLLTDPIVADMLTSCRLLSWQEFSKEYATIRGVEHYCKIDRWML